MSALRFEGIELCVAKPLESSVIECRHSTPLAVITLREFLVFADFCRFQCVVKRQPFVVKLVQMLREVFDVAVDIRQYDAGHLRTVLGLCWWRCP